MKKYLVSILLTIFVSYPAITHCEDYKYTPTKENLEARQRFSGNRFGIFLHWGIYSMFGQGEWYLNYGVKADEYAKAAGGFYPANFDAKKWVEAIKDSGAKYICFTSRHHDGFSMWHTAQSPYNIVDATPFKRDIIKELSDQCHEQGINLHLYYSHLDWTRPDYPRGRTGLETRDTNDGSNWQSYYGFMNAQLTELLTNYGKIDAIWFDGWWDHDSDSIPFDWQLPAQYDLIHSLQPQCLVGNNHHQIPFPGEDIQIFERDVPGENKAGLSGQDISVLPLETCQTMNGMWGYKIKDQNYKSTDDIIRLLVNTAGRGANLLLNIGPQPDGQLPATALERLSEIGDWIRVYGETIYGTTAGDIAPHAWGASTRKGDKLFVHILDSADTAIFLPLRYKPQKVVDFATRKPIEFTKVKDGVVITLPDSITKPDFVVEII